LEAPSIRQVSTHQKTRPRMTHGKSGMRLERSSDEFIGGRW
jgi:hypothetical protein